MGPFGKRKFIDCGEDDPDAKRIVEMINTLYQNEHKHKIGVDGWTVEQNLVHRKKYAPDILGEINPSIRLRSLLSGNVSKLSKIALQLSIKL